MINITETKMRSGSKSIVWRLFGVLILAVITYVYTKKWITTGLITAIHHGIFLMVYYFHERLWLRVKRVQNLTYRSLLKMLTYETLCGNIILGTIAYLVTGSWKQMTAITLTYIGIKHVVYIFNEFVWDKIKTGKTVAAIMSMLIFSSICFADYWNTSAVQYKNFKADVEFRMDNDMYYKHIHLDWHHKLNRHLTLTLSGRESYIKKAMWRVEHKPMLSLTYESGILKNRARMTLRIKEGKDIWRLRNKLTATLSPWFVALEAFFERGRWFRNRYYVGANVTKNLSIFLMRQYTEGEGIWVIGTKLMARF